MFICCAGKIHCTRSHTSAGLPGPKTFRALWIMDYLLSYSRPEFVRSRTTSATAFLPDRSVQTFDRPASSGRSNKQLSYLVRSNNTPAHNRMTPKIPQFLPFDRPSHCGMNDKIAGIHITAMSVQCRDNLLFTLLIISATDF